MKKAMKCDQFCFFQKFIPKVNLKSFICLEHSTVPSGPPHVLRCVSSEIGHLSTVFHFSERLAGLMGFARLQANFEARCALNRAGQSRPAQWDPS